MTTFLCTDCKVYFSGEKTPPGERDKGTCPECGADYSGFFTRLIRAGTFAEAYWQDANPDAEIRDLTDKDADRSDEAVVLRGVLIAGEDDERR